jgi:hypothetical protein
MYRVNLLDGSSFIVQDGFPAEQAPPGVFRAPSGSFGWHTRGAISYGYASAEIAYEKYLAHIPSPPAEPLPDGHEWIFDSDARTWHARDTDNLETWE